MPEHDASADATASPAVLRSMARLGAVQALYQMEMAGTDIGVVQAQFEAYRLGQEVDGEQYKPADLAHFRDILKGVVDHQKEIDDAIRDHLAAGWTLKRIDSILRAILRAGVYELNCRPDVPVKVVINEYVDVAHGFFDGDEPRVVNGILDRLARKIRAGDFGG